MFGSRKIRATLWAVVMLLTGVYMFSAGSSAATDDKAAVSGVGAEVVVTVTGPAVEAGAVSGTAVWPGETEAASGPGASVVTGVVSGSVVALNRYTATAYILDDINWAEAVFEVTGCSVGMDRTLTCIPADPVKDIEIHWTAGKTDCFSLCTYNTGHTTVTVTLGDNEFLIDLTVKKTPINVSSKVLDLGKSVTLKLKNYPGTPSWKSTAPSVASVDKKGKVRAKKVGNAIIYADIDGHRTGCIVSVVKKGISSVVKIARFIGTHWTYSQPRRMSVKYYDCSSLVWKAYRKSGRYVCGAYAYAPVAADIGRWCVNRRRVLGKFRESNIGKMKYLPGDVLLKVHMRGDRYMGIGHIEMITGYNLHGFIGKKPVLYLTWGAREEGYGASRKDDFVGRPYN